MSVCFYNTKGVMVGIDLHRFAAAAPPDPAPIPVPVFPHVVGAPLSWGICDTKSMLRTVTSDGAPMLQRNHKKKFVPHVFLPIALPHPAEAELLIEAVGKSSSVCGMAVAGVTGGGAPLATCLLGFWGLNENCNLPVTMPTGNVINPNTVKTTPTAADYVDAALSLAVSAILSHDKAKTLKKIRTWLKVGDAVLKFLFKHVLKAPGRPTPLLWGDVEKHIREKSEEYVRKLLGGHS